MPRKYSFNQSCKIKLWSYDCKNSQFHNTTNSFVFREYHNHNKIWSSRCSQFVKLWKLWNGSGNIILDLICSVLKNSKNKKKYHWRNALQFIIQIFEWFSKFKMKKSQKSQIVMTTISQRNTIFSRLFYNSAFNGCVMCSTTCSFNFLKSKENLKLIKCAGKYWAHSIQWNAMMSLFDI